MQTEPDTVRVRKAKALGLICELRLYIIKMKDCRSWHEGPRFIASIFSMRSFIARCNISTLPNFEKKNENNIITYQ